MRWLANRYGKQRERTKYKSSDRQTKWARWPQHINAPTKADMRRFTALYDPRKDYLTTYELGSGIRMIAHPTHVWYFDGIHSTCFAGLVFPDGTEWWPLHATND